MRIIGYLSHPLGSKDNLQKRHDNIASTCDWIRFLVLSTRWCMCVPWLPHILAVDDEMLRPRVIADQITILARCDALILVGGYLSSHMTIERQHAMDTGLPVIDLTDLGEMPPENPGTHWEDLFMQRATSPVVIRQYR